MSMNIVFEFKNDLLKRRELVLESRYESNPGEARGLEDVAKEVKRQEENIVVKHLFSHFGSDVFKIEAFVYDSVKDKEATEPKKKEKKKK